MNMLLFLHYTKLDHQSPDEYRSFLIDAGAEYNGYAADITRTYSAKENHEFTALVKDMNDAQQALIATMKSGEYATANIIFKCINVLPDYYINTVLLRGLAKKRW